MRDTYSCDTRALKAFTQVALCYPSYRTRTAGLLERPGCFKACRAPSTRKARRHDKHGMATTARHGGQRVRRPVLADRTAAYPQMSLTWNALNPKP